MSRLAMAIAQTLREKQVQFLHGPLFGIVLSGASFSKVRAHIPDFKQEVS